MTAINFPDSPSNGDTHVVGGVTYTYDSTETKWKTTINSNAFLPLTGGTVSGNIVLGGELQHSGDTDTKLHFDTDTIKFDTAGSERARIDSSGRLLVGTTSARTNINNESWSGNVALNVEGANAFGTAVNIVNNYNGNGYSFLNFLKSNTTSVGSNTIVTSGNTLGLITFQGNDGTEFVQAAAILAAVDTTPGANDMPGRLMFMTTANGTSSPVERMRINNAGTHSFFCTATTAGIMATSSGAGTSVVTFACRHSASNVATGTDAMYVFSNGNLVNTNNSYGAISDIKLKENIVDANSQWDDFKALQVRNYNFKEGQTHTQIGLIAQEVELVSPGLVTESPDRDEDGNDLGTVTKSVNYSVLYMKAVKALQEAMERIETLETRLTALEGGAA
jgi:hypothetical protein